MGTLIDLDWFNPRLRDGPLPRKGNKCPNCREEALCDVPVISSCFHKVCLKCKKHYATSREEYMENSRRNGLETAISILHEKEMNDFFDKEDMCE